MFQLAQKLCDNTNNEFVENNNFFLNYFRVHGLAPLIFGKEGGKIIWIFRTHTLLIIIGLCINVYFIATQKDYSINIGGVSWFADISVWFGPCWVTLIGCIEQLFKSKKQKRLILLINHLDTLLRDGFKCVIHYSTLRKYKYVKYGLIQLIIWTTMLIISRNIFWNNFGQYYFQLLIACHLVYTFSMMLVFYFDSVHDRLGVCSDQIKTLMEEDSMVWFTKRENISNRLTNKLSTKQLFLIKDIIGVAEETFKLLNQCFGWTLVFLVIAYGIEIICNAYWIFLVVSNAAKAVSVWGKYE